MEATLPIAARSRRVRRGATALVAALTASSLGILAPGGTAHAVDLPTRPMLVSRSTAGALATPYSGFSGLSGDGRFALFVTAAKLTADDTNGLNDVYLRDRWAATTERISVSSSEVGANAASGFPAISDDGRMVVFQSYATNLGGTDVLDHPDVFVRDRVAGTTTRVSVTTSGGELASGSGGAAISGNGRYVAFDTSAAGVVAGDTNAKSDIFVRDLTTGTTERVSVTSAEAQATDNSDSPSFSDDGRYVAFTSRAELAGGRPGDGRDVFVRDRTAGTTINANLTSGGVMADGDAWPPVISGSGRFVAFGSDATNLAIDTNGHTDAYRRDIVAGTTIRLSLADNESQLPLGGYPRAISDNGTRVLFDSSSPATPGDAGTDMDVFLRNISTSSTRRVSTSPTGPDVATLGLSQSLSDDGTAAAFSTSSGLVPDHAGGEQVYVDEALHLGPHASLAAFVNQQYLDFVGRPATAAEQNAWQAKIEDGRSHPAALIATLAKADAFSKYRAPVTRLYWAFFLRKPDAGGLSYWITKYQGGTKLSTIADGFARSSEFTNRYGALTNQQFVAKIYPNIFERQPDAGGLAFWTAKLDSGALTRGDVMVGFSESSEGARRLAPQVFITLISQGMLRESPSTAFWDAAFAAYDGGETELAWLAQTTLTSSAYASRFA